MQRNLHWLYILNKFWRSTAAKQIERVKATFQNETNLRIWIRVVKRSTFLSFKFCFCLNCLRGVLLQVVFSCQKGGFINFFSDVNKKRIICVFLIFLFPFSPSLRNKMIWFFSKKNNKKLFLSLYFWKVRNGYDFLKNSNMLLFLRIFINRWKV